MTLKKITTDSHTHTGFSDDCDIAAEDMIKSAILKNIEILTITDHYDPGYPDPEFPFDMDFSLYQTTLEKYRQKYKSHIDLRTGLEIGIMEGQFKQAENVISAYTYDMIIGSFHCLEGDDLYTYDYDAADGPALLEKFYMYMHRCLREFKNYDIIGHFSLPDRYIGQLYSYEPYENIIDELLKLIISDGKGLEINTSSFRYGTDAWLPRESILKRYYELGGDILTFGSDAHSPDFLQSHFEDAAELARSIGFRHHCVFNQRKAEFIPL